MKVAITGHTSGIGKAFADECRSRGFEVVGFSRSTGTNIAELSDQDFILSSINDCDIFINNAHDRFGQVELFSKVWQSWKNKSRLIINIGTFVTSTRTGANGPQHVMGRAHYAAEKVGLEMAVNWAWCDSDSCCEAIIVRPGLTDTPRVADDRPGAPRVDATSMAKYVMSSVLEQPFVVRELVITPRKNNA